MSQDSPEHKRRVRYKGRNPRRFEDRYKELNPTRYSGDVEHIIAKGNTPAGSHRPICVEEILSVLNPQPGDTCLDATLGYGGHALHLLKRVLPGGRLFALDVDPLELPKTEVRLRAQGFDEEALVIRSMNFSGVRALLSEAGGGFDCVLADLGVSSMQLDNPARGFSYKADGPLDLRLNPKRGKSAAQLLTGISLEDLEALLRDNADEPHARLLAQAIKNSPAPLLGTEQLAQILRQALESIRPKVCSLKKSLQRTFMALRIAVNEELSVLDRFLQVLPYSLNAGGRVAILSFHSGEDRRVKKAFALGLQSGLYARVAPAPVLPTADECRANPRASCAKLRWAIRSDLPIQ